jgi:hypothetical protein
MKKSRYSDSQILAILKQAESGTPVPACIATACHQQHPVNPGQTSYLGGDVGLYRYALHTFQAIQCD